MRFDKREFFKTPSASSLLDEALPRASKGIINGFLQSIFKKNLKEKRFFYGGENGGSIPPISGVRMMITGRFAFMDTVYAVLPIRSSRNQPVP